MPEDKDDFLPFENVEGINPMPSFGAGFNIHVTGLTHDERGYPDTNSPETHQTLVKRLCNKVLKIKIKFVLFKVKIVKMPILLLYLMVLRSGLL